MDPSKELLVDEIAEHFQRALVLFQQGKVERAIEILTERLKLARKILPPHHGLYSSLLINLADCHLQLGNYALAEQLVEEHLEELGENGNAAVLENCRNVLAQIYMRTLRISQAEAMLLKSIDERSKRLGELHPLQIPDYHLLGLIYLTTARFEDAKNLLPRMAQMRSNIGPGEQDAQGLAEMVSKSFELMGNAIDDTAAGLKPEGPIEKFDDITFYQREAGCWREFADRRFNTAANSALALLVKRSTLRVWEIRLLSLLWMGENVEEDGERALALAPHGSWERMLIKFTLGRASLSAVLELASEADDFTQIYFYAGLLALSAGNEENARDCFQKAYQTASEIPEHAQAAEELEALDQLARDISQFGLEKQIQFRNAYQSFALLDYRGFGVSLRPSGLNQVLTPQLLLMFVVSLRALGQVEISNGLVPHVRRLLSRWRWHAQLLDLLTGRVAAQALLSKAHDAVQVCQLHYYAMIQKRASGQWEEALIHREASLKTMANCPERELAELDGSDPAAMIDNVNGVLTVLAGTGQLAMAEQLGRASLAAARNLPGLDPVIFAGALANLATVMGSEGNLAESLQLFNELETIGAKLPAEKVFIDSLNTGQLCIEHGLHSEAARFLSKARQISESNEFKPYLMMGLFNALGRLAADSGDPDTSIRWHEDALSIFKEKGFENEVLHAAIVDNIGLAFATKQSYREALDKHEEAYEILSKATFSGGGFISNSHPSLCKILTNWAWVLTRLGQYEEAEKRGNEALRICKGTGANMDYVKGFVLYQLAMTFAVSNRPSEALEKLLQASALDDKELGEKMALHSDELRMAYAASAQFALSALLSIAGSSFSTDSARLEGVFDVVLRRKGLVAEAAAVQRDAILLGRYLHLRPLLEELSSLQRQIAASTFAGTRNDVPFESQAEIDSKRERKRWLEAALAKDIPELQLDIALRQVNARNLLSTLPKNWSIVEFVRSPVCNLMIAGGPANPAFSEDRYWAFVIPSADLDSLKLIDFGPADLLDEIVVHFLSRLDDSPERRAPSTQDLREKLIDPLFSILPRDGHVLIAPDGLLAQLPFEVLIDREGRYLIDRYSFSYVATCRDLVRLSVSGQNELSQDIIVADPDFDHSPAGARGRSANDRRFTPLPGTRREGQAIADILGVKPWFGADALESRIMQASSPRILHLATHGFFYKAEQPEPSPSENWLRGLRDPALTQNMLNPLFRSGLAFAGANIGTSGLPNEIDDGLLSAAEVTAMNLVGTELVVLSACETGLGTLHATEGVMGLRRAFQLAGARTVIASLWRVPDQQTCDLMTGFYRRLITGMPRDAALRAAQLELRQKFPSPFYWGAFVCFGDTKAIAGMERMNIYDSVANLTSAQNAGKEIAKLSSLINRGSMDSTVWSQRGIYYHNLRRFAEAIEDFNRAAELAPNDAVVFFNRGFSLHLLKRDEDAVKDFNRAIELQPDLVIAYHRRGNTFASLGDWKLALKDLDYAITLESNDADIFYDRAGLLASLGRLQEAIADYTNAIRLRPSFEIAYVNRATISFQFNKPDDAIQDLKTAIQLVPDDALAHLNLGSAYALSGDIQRALKSWERAAQLGDANVVHAARKMQAEISRYETKMSQKRGS